MPSLPHHDRGGRAVTDRWTEGLVVFLIGMRVNAWWRPDIWVPVVRAMARMVRVLEQQPELGLLGVMRAGAANPVVIVQYWRSFEHLEHFASAADGMHVEAWRDWNRRVRATNVVGVWHETYVVEPGAHESVYLNMPPFGLGAAHGTQPALGASTGARGRLASRRR